MTIPGEELARQISAANTPLYGEQLRPDDGLFFSNSLLEDRLSAVLVGRSYAGLPIRTRSKTAKIDVCEALGYEVPISFAKTSPRFPSQNFDLYVQQSNNLQVWNQEVDESRRYVVLGLDDSSTVHAVRVVSGQELTLLDRTRALTSKYQASLIGDAGATRLLSEQDTENFVSVLEPVEEVHASWRSSMIPTGPPTSGKVLTVRALFEALRPLVGSRFRDPGATQDRLRSVELQRAACSALGLFGYADGGQFPDIPAQAVELKLQLSRTIDLGLVSPDDRSVATELGTAVRHCDVRYAVFFGTKSSTESLTIDGLTVSTGQDFFTAFRRFEGRVINRKLQIRLPSNFYSLRP